jgi:hypothetical protein
VTDIGAMKVGFELLSVQWTFVERISKPLPGHGLGVLLADFVNG